MSESLLSDQLLDLMRSALADKFEAEKSAIEKHLIQSAQKGLPFAFVKFNESDPALYYFIKRWLNHNGLKITVISRFGVNKVPCQIAIHFVDLGDDLCFDALKVEVIQ